MKLHKFLKDTTAFIDLSPIKIDMLEVRPSIVCQDGFEMSVQASTHHYCVPRENLKDGGYSHVEVGFPSHEEVLLVEYAECPDSPTKTVYGYVPVEIVEQVIEKHGGVVLLT